MKLKVIKSIIISMGAIIFAILFVSIGFIKAEYPLAYKATISEASQEFGVEECLIAAVIKTESDFNTISVSHKGAVGLMQIMPSTAKMIASHLDLEWEGESVLFNPQTNIRFGTYYLKYLMDKYDSELEVLFAYNAGEGTLEQVLKNKDQLTMGAVTITETHNYIKRVEKTKEVYKKLYNYF